jgi:eukaryotic-like serine/threonine-protein kinase
VAAIASLSLREVRSRANMTKSLPSLSQPAARRLDDLAPAEGAVAGFVCPQCQLRFGEEAGPQSCPNDHAPLLRVADFLAGAGDPMLGRVLAGRFTILARLGAGSMGTVYRAKQSPIGREVAIKILRSDRAIDEVSRARFLREARANSLLASPNTVTVFDFGQGEDGDFYLAMELLEGESLGQRIKRVGRIGVDDAIETVKQALRSLGEAHAKGIIHRDLKPDNLFYAQVRTNDKFEEIVKVLDFGIAKMIQTDGELAMNAVETQAGTVFGTPRYMSPEQAQGKPLDARSDLYSLGVILYHMLTGRPPFTDDDAIVVMARHIRTPPRSISEVAPEARIPADLENLVMRLLSKDADKRPQTADALIAELSRVKDAGVQTSGVRVSAPPGSGPGIEGAVSLTPVPAQSSALTYDTLSIQTGLPSAFRRWVIVVGALAVLASLAAIVVASGLRRPASQTAAITAGSALGEPPAVVSTGIPASMPVLVSPASATSSTAPTAATASASPPRPVQHPEIFRTDRHLQRPRPPTGPLKPAGSSSVGYGYLE